MKKRFHLHSALILSILGISLTLAIGLINLDISKISAQTQETIF